MPSEVFDQLARGDGDTQGILRAGQRSKRLLLLYELVTEARSRVPRLCASAGTDEAFAVLVDAQRRCPHVVDDLLLQPHVGAWATHCVRALVGPGEISPADLGHLGTVAASAAARAGLPFAVTAHLHDDGSLMFPTFGLAHPASRPDWCRIRSRTGDHVEIATATTTTSIDLASRSDTPTWQPLRHLRSTANGLTIDLHLDDLDPYRGSADLPTAPRLTDSELERWQQALDDSWAWLVPKQGQRVGPIAEGVVALVPLTSPAQDIDLSGTRHDALGAVATTLPSDARKLGSALVHEYQHNKLSTLADLVPLARRLSAEPYYAPWRDGPRPLWGLLHGAYAYLGLAVSAAQECRGELDDRGSPDIGLARFDLALWRDQVGHALGSLRRSTGLTPAGRRFVETMRARLSDLRRTPIPARPRLLARAACLDHATSWRLRNLVPDPGLVEEWAEAWLTGRPPPIRPAARPRPIDGATPIPSAARLILFRSQFEPLTAGTEIHQDANSGDDRLVEGDLGGAAHAYRERIFNESLDAPAWAGLALVRRYLSNDATTALTKTPELVRALHQRVRERAGEAPDPEHLAAWMIAPPGVGQRAGGSKSSAIRSPLVASATSKWSSGRMLL